MIYNASPFAVAIFVAFVLGVLWLSSYFAKKTTTSAGYYAAGGDIHWGVNGIAFAGDYLSAASFLGICGMIAFSGYDGFLYSIGYLAGWVVALFIVAEPMKRLGKYTFTDALNNKYNSRGIHLTAAISTLIVSICYLVPQMVGAGSLVTPLLGMPHYVGVILVGAIVIFIVATAGMASTTYVQFFKGGLLIIFSSVLTIAIFVHGIKTQPSEDYHKFQTINATVMNGEVTAIDSDAYRIAGAHQDAKGHYVKLNKEGVNTWWRLVEEDGNAYLDETLTVVNSKDGQVLYNGEPKEAQKFFQVGHVSKLIVDGEEVTETGSVSPFKFLTTVEESTVVRFGKVVFMDQGEKVQLWYQNPTSGQDIMRPGLRFKVDKGSTFMSKLDFVSLMIALFFGTSALPHILIRYYTVPSPKAARKSTILAIAAIGFFYVLTLFMGLGAMVNGVLDVQSSNMAGPLLAKFFGIALFSIISAIAFATVLGTVSGLIVAASGAVAHDLIANYLGIPLTDKGQVKAGKIAAVVVGVFAIALGILFKGINVSFLVGLAFAVAASANLPAILMMLFWKKTTAKGISASIIVGIISAMTIILLSPKTFEVYGLLPSSAPIAMNNPGIISIPLAFITLIVVSLMTQKDGVGTEEKRLT
ncbi:solute symporter family protein [Desulfobacter latus]|uniref:Cation acetate symporter n=1 Tax=Desulfobacter latus TaxID=2292 RepID=A0A850SRU9_9BACT|nr:cation acetate symporter [Desulfobacter latus]NWH04154.1 cation acetate symporter [Desulfobacter latus]